MNHRLEVGKLPSHILDRAVIDQLKHNRPEVLFGSTLGGDTAVIDPAEDLVVLSSDPITGSASNLGKLAVHISANDISTQGAEAVGILLTLLLPVGTTEEEVQAIMAEAQEESSRLNMEIVGGHTEVTEAVNRIVAVSTVIGKVAPQDRPSLDRVRPGHLVAVSKHIALEGTAILAHDKAEDLAQVLSPQELKEAQGLMEKVSVYKEGQSAQVASLGYMHDITEGGLLGALWEASHLLGYGIEVHEDRVPLLATSKKICDHYGLDPYRLISSGSMLMVLDEEAFKKAQAYLEGQGIGLSAIGQIVQDKGAYFIRQEDGARQEIKDISSDELYRVI
ncbi:MAG: AIR synthase family protein [Tissierellia bacterium]|nr:AIR synthase family protein [Tissierellia bacterium]